LNNLAVILWRQNALMAALSHYDQAMLAAPVNKEILDNVAEALAGLADDQRKNVIAQRAFRRFAEQDKRLQEMMAAQGFYRWGATWVDRDAMQHLKDQEQQVNQKLAKANADADAARKQIDSLDHEIASTERSMRQIEAQALYRDGNGNLVRMPY